MTGRSPEDIVWDVLFGALATRALAVVADLRVAELLGDGPRSVEDIARGVGADADTLHRLLRALASNGIFTEQTYGVFANTAASEVLLNQGYRDFAHLFGNVWHRTVGELNAVPAPVFPRVFGTDFWSWLAVNPSERAAFDRAMERATTWKFERLEAAEWRGDETVVDIGGGNGALLVKLLRQQPGLRGIVFDLPETSRDESSFGDKITFVAGDFFDRVPSGDVYILSTILHDWDDERAIAILRTIRRAAPAHGRLLVVDAVIPAGNEPHGAKWLDLLMLALFAGRERDAEQWRALLDAGGFEAVRVDEQGLIEARCR